MNQHSYVFIGTCTYFDDGPRLYIPTVTINYIYKYNIYWKYTIYIKNHFLIILMRAGAC